MPLYDFECAACGPFVSFRLIDDRNLPASCPTCSQVVRRTISAPNLCLMPGTTRKAHSINERSRHEPTVRRGHQCGSGCGCAPGKSVRRGKKVTPAGGKLGEFQMASGNSARPWMLGH